MKFDKVKDSGAREDMSTGSRRDTQVGKSRPDLMNPLVLRRLGMHFANGCDKYGEKNFELGQNTSRYRASLGRHMLDYDEGLKDEDHLAAIIWNAMGIMMNQEFVERGIYEPSIDDFSDYRHREGFYATVGQRALAHNKKQQKAEEETTITTDEKAVPPCLNCTFCCVDCRKLSECKAYSCYTCEYDHICDKDEHGDENIRLQLITPPVQELDCDCEYCQPGVGMYPGFC